MISTYSSIYDRLADSPLFPIDDNQILVEETSTEGVYVGRSGIGRPALLVETGAGPGTGITYQLQGLEAHTSATLSIRSPNGDPSVFNGGVITCLSTDAEDVAYFLSICESLVKLIGEYPSPTALRDGLDRIVSLFAKMQEIPRKSIIGFTGELLYIAACKDVVSAVKSWRLTEFDRFDFTYPLAHIEVKTSLGRHRSHTVAYDQVVSSVSRAVFFASVLIERSPRGISGRVLLEDVLSKCRGNLDAQLKVHRIAAETLGSDLGNFLRFTFDEGQALAGIRIFRAEDIPAIRCELPIGVSRVRFTSDFSLCRSVRPSEVSAPGLQSG